MEKVKRLWELPGKTVPEPYRRNVQLAYTPQLDPGIKDCTLLIATLYPLDGQNELHTHTVDEMMVINSGRGEALVGGKWHLLEPGVVLYVPAGEEHQCKNYSEETMRMTCIYVPALPDEAVKALVEDSSRRCGV